MTNEEYLKKNKMKFIELILKELHNITGFRIDPLWQFIEFTCKEVEERTKENLLTGHYLVKKKAGKSDYRYKGLTPRQLQLAKTLWEYYLYNPKMPKTIDLAIEYNVTKATMRSLLLKLQREGYINLQRQIYLNVPAIKSLFNS